MNKHPYSVERFQFGIEVLYQQIIDSGIQYNHIVGLSRGGLVPAVSLSHKLGVPLIPVVWSTTSKKGNIDVMDLVDNPRHRILVVDDILDSGVTMKTFLDYHGKMDVGVLIYNAEQEVVPNYYVETINRSVFPNWIDFWWETL